MQVITHYHHLAIGLCLASLIAGVSHVPISARDFFTGNSFSSRAAGDVMKNRRSVNNSGNDLGEAINLLVTKGDTEMAAGHFANARNCYTSALARDPNNVTIILKASKAEEKIGDLDGAIRRARFATKLEPKNADAHAVLGQFLQANRDERAAELQYECAAELSKGDELASQYERKAIELMIACDDLERADKLSLSWLKANGKDADRHFNRGLVLAQSERAERQQEAIKELTKTLLLAPAYNRAHYQLALLYLKLDEKEKAKTELKTFINNNPDEPELKEAKEKLVQL